MTTQQRTHLPIPSSTLTGWAEDHLARMFKAGQNDQAFETAYNTLIKEDATIIVNGQPMSSADYKQRMRRMIEEGRAGAAVAFTGAVEVPQGKNVDNQSEGTVGLFMHATMDEYIVLGVPESATVTASYNMRVAIDKNLAIPPGDAVPDFRRVVAMSEVSVDRRHSLLPPVGGPGFGRQG